MIDLSAFFQCQMCGDCCKGYGGTFVRQEDIKAISEYLHIDTDTFLADYCQWSGKRPVIKTADSGYCIFWDEVCTIHQIKPRMCKLWPFIESVLVDPANWPAMHSMCPGIQKEVDEEALVSCVRQVLAEYENAEMEADRSMLNAYNQSSRQDAKKKDLSLGALATLRENKNMIINFADRTHHTNSKPSTFGFHRGTPL